MLKRSFWLAAIVAPLCFSPACELVSDAVIQGGLKGDYDGHDKDGEGSGGRGGEGGRGAKGGHDDHACKPIDKEAAAGCMDPRWEDTDRDGCIDYYVCGDYTGDVNPVECKPFPKEWLEGCVEPLIEDRDNDGCIDYFACLDGKGEPVGGPDDKEPVMCKPLPSTDGCAKPHFEDRDADGCIDLFICLDYVEAQPPVRPTK